MELREIYKQLEGSYDDMIGRVRKESMIEMFLEEFLNDQEFFKLQKAIEAKDDTAAFEAAHTLKGVALNMELGFLSRSVSELTENLRHGRTSKVDDLFEQVKADYERTVKILQQR